MTRIRAYLDALEDPACPVPPGPRTIQDHVMLAVVALVVVADGEVSEDEVEVFRRLAPEFNDAQIRAFIQRVAKDGLDIRQVAKVFPSEDERDDLVELVERAVWADGLVHSGERAVLMQILRGLEE